MNKIILVGNLTRDMELRYTQSGGAVGKSGIAVNKKYKNQNGDQIEDVMFIDFTLWGRAAEIANQYLKKGSQVLIEGELKLEQWTDQSGQKKSKHTVTAQNMKMLGGKNDNQGQRSQAQNSYQPKQRQEDPEMGIDDNSDTIPF